MSKQVLKALPELTAAGIISEDTAAQIKKYYESLPGQSNNRLFIVFGILGSLLVGLGLVLIIAHNWDMLPKGIKLSIGLIPLLVAQIISGYLIFTRSENRGWREGASCFLMVSVAISISIVGQVYNVEGSLGRFLFVWMVLSLPIVYALWSSMASLLFICGITWYACETAYFSYPHNEAPYYWVLLLLIIPFYYLAYIKKGLMSNFFYFHNWLLAASISTCLGAFSNHTGELLLVAYMSLFSIFVLMGSIKTFDTGRVLSNAYLVIGSLGVIILMLSLSFSFFWDEVGSLLNQNIVKTPEFFVSGVLTLIALILLLRELRLKKGHGLNYKSFAFAVVIVLFIVGMGSPVIAQIGVNITILLFAVNTILSGAKKNHLGILNYGLLIIAALIICRFFDTDFSFVIRGLLFILVGVGFFATNYYLIRKRKNTP